ncbi:hypothetical protein [Streptomyces specialis]|uniref:hypothetical protein n=1 Tax=Streptomyces specialis TaxID=498367 RepID=UPI00073F4E84|nr:hypothetical protein [Streptomyces specialis]
MSRVDARTSEAAHDRDGDAPAGPAGTRARPRRRRDRPRDGARAGRRALVALVAAVVGVAAALAVPAVRDELRNSFTRLPSEYAELYFTALPTVEGTTAVVPVTLADHHTGTGSYRLRVWLESADGEITASDTITVVPEGDTPAPSVIRLPMRGDPVAVGVELLGHDQTLHYRFETGGTP